MRDMGTTKRGNAEKTEIRKNIRVGTQKKTEKKRKEIECKSIPHSVLRAVLAIVIFGVSLRNIGKVYQLYVLHDEFGYWMNAAHFAGYDWSGIASISPYYSYGYSLFLTPLFWLFSNPVIMYRAAIVLNAFFYMGSFLLSLQCAEKMFPETKKGILTAFCFVAAFYCNNLLQSNMAWAEAVLYFWFWLLLYTLLCFLDKQRLLYAALFVLELVYLYIIHQRALGVVIAGLGALFLILLFRNKRNWKKIFAVTVILAACLIVAVLVKKYFQDNLWRWDNEEIAGRNDYSGQLWKIEYILTTWKGMLEMLISFAGKVCYLLVSSGSLIFWAVLSGVALLRNGFADRKNYAVVFIGLSLFFTVGINAIMMLKGERIDCAIYGRYSEFLMGILLIMGMQFLYEKRLRFLQFLGYAGVLLFCGKGVKAALETRQTFTYIQSVGAGLFYNNESGKFLLAEYLLFGIAVGGIVYCAGRWKKKGLYVCALTVLMGYWIFSSQESLNKEVISEQANIKNVAHISQLIEGVEGVYPIYFVEDYDADFLNYRIENIQFMLRDRKIQLLTYEQVYALEGEYYLIQFGVDDLDLTRYDIVSQAHGMVVMVPKATELAEKCLAYNRENPYVFSETMMSSETQGKEYGFDSDYKAGFLVFAQNLFLSPGKYQVTMDIEVLENDEEESIGSYDVSYEYGQALLYSEELQPDRVNEDGIAHIVYEFSCTDAVQHAEFRFYTFGSTKLQLQKLEYLRID